MHAVVGATRGIDCRRRHVPHCLLGRRDAGIRAAVPDGGTPSTSRNVGSGDRTRARESATIGISGPEPDDLTGLEQVSVGAVELIPVAAPSHPLASGAHPLPGAARDHVQLELADRSLLTKGKDFGVLGNRSWRLADLGSKHALLVAGIGWGSLPEPTVRADLAAGRLKRLDLPEWRSSLYAMQAIYRTETPPCRAAGWLISRFVEQADQIW